MAAICFILKLSVFLLQIQLFHVCRAYFCDLYTCNSDQYCCGLNKCCDYWYNKWYFWTGIVVVSVIIVLICCTMKVPCKLRTLCYSLCQRFRASEDTTRILSTPVKSKEEPHVATYTKALPHQMVTPCSVSDQ